ncbi:hypothetical protein CDD82_4456 [Ophiocordyceps australis]|uniref:RBR-type E3 ubiquitin transferase n=1 Tax=Ophiocordyceps australis TaxID=1399860 RepID=A0A2C5Z6Q3_9HYPO|nr:hypothetical protein CDD82_4456 [Ophiocordyceps australis]
MDSRNWKPPASPSHHSPPRLRRSRVHNASSQAQYSSTSTEAQVSKMPPPPHLAPSPTDVYRRPGHWMALDNSICHRGPSIRDSPPLYRGRRHFAPEWSAYSSTSALGYRGDGYLDPNPAAADGIDDPDDDNQIEVVEEMDSDSARLMARGRQPSRNIDGFYPTKHQRHGMRPHRRISHDDDDDGDDDDDDQDSDYHHHRPARRRHASPSPGESSIREKPRRAVDKGVGVPGLHSRHLTFPIMIDDSRPPLSSSRPTGRRRHRSVGVIELESRPRRASRARSSHSRSGSATGGPSGFMGAILGAGQLDRVSPDRPIKESRATKRMVADFSTKNRLYCPSRRCREWINPDNIGRENGQKVARCGRCKTKICCICSGKWHGTSECHKDEETARLLAQAQEEGWKRCYRCKAVVELNEGCNQMTCRCCGAEFCMICGVRWKACDCPWFNDGPDVKTDRFGHGISGKPRSREIMHSDLEDEHPGHEVAAMALPVRPRPRSYEEDALARRLNEQRQAPAGRHLAYDKGYYANGDYEHESRHPPSRAVAPFATAALRVDKAGDSTGLGRGRGRRGDSMERRLADRLSDARSGGGLRTTTIKMREEARQHSIDGNMYNRAVAPRLERLAGGRVSRSFEDEAPAARNCRRRCSEGHAPKSSDMAGLSGPGQGMSRVSQWRSFVQPGVPEDDKMFGPA